MTDHERAYWLADKIPAYGDYAKEAACVLRKQADEIDRLTRELADLKADRDSWIEQASARAQETVEAMQQVEAYRLRCEALHSAPREPLTDEQLRAVGAEHYGTLMTEQEMRFARSVERAHGIQEHQ